MVSFFEQDSGGELWEYYGRPGRHLERRQYVFVVVSYQEAWLLLTSSTDVTDQPETYSVHNCSETNDVQKHMIIMLDLNIPDSDVTTADEYVTLVLGLAVNTTTRLHWWGGNYTLDPASGAYVNSSDALSAYTAPRPRDEVFHNYVTYLFEQPASYVPSETALNGTYYDQTTAARFNFSLTPIIEAVGQPIAANYFIANNGSQIA